jgi:hypothetical protein
MAFAMYLDEDSQNHGFLAALRRMGIDATSAVEAGRTGLPDPEQLAIARTEGRVLYSANRAHFARLHREIVEGGGSHAGVILLTDQRIGMGDQLRGIAVLQRRFSQSDFRDWLEWIGRSPRA